MNACGMRQMEERHVANQVDLMVWSNRLDLLAISNFKGEVQIHRLHWQKVWNFPPPKENVTVRTMAWRPDGKALAVGYSSGSVYIIDIEDKEVLEKFDLEVETMGDFDDAKHYGITCLTWAVREGTLESATEYNIYDDASIFLQKPPSPTQSSGFKNQETSDNIKDLKEVQEPTQLNMIIVGYGTGYIYMNIFGRYSYGTLHLAQVAKDECGEYNVLDIKMSDDFSMMQVFYLDIMTNNVFVALLNTSVLSAYAEEMFVVANKHGQVTHLMSYLDQTMTSITEAWEHILLEMDNKMACYAASVPDGGVSADLLELLMMGVVSDELELFLIHELTPKGLKKFGSSVELSYSTIQKLVLRQLNIVGQSLTYYLAEMRGLTRIPDRYKIVGLEEATVTEAIKACCAFLNKCLELQQVIDVSMRNYKAFFRWLFVVIVRLLDEVTPSEIVKITQQDLSHIAEFLYNFDIVPVHNNDGSGEKQVKFNLERLGQYLLDQNLTLPPDDEDNSWHTFLNENSCLLKDSDTIFPMTEFKKFSLIQQQKHLKNAINKVFNVSENDIGKYFSVLFNVKCFENKTEQFAQNKLRISQVYDSNNHRFLAAFVNTNTEHDCMCFMSADIQENACVATAVNYYFTSNLVPDPDNQTNDDAILSVLDLQFYSTEHLSILISHKEKDSSIFIQLPTQIAVDSSVEFNIKSKSSTVFNEKVPKKNLTAQIEQSMYKVLEKMDGLRIAVSGGRKVSVVLSKTHRKVRVFEMEVDGDEEEDDTLDVTPQSQVSRRSDEQATPDKSSVTTEDITF